MLHLMKLNLGNSDDERGHVRAMLILRRFSLDVYTWSNWKFKAWWYPSVGVLGDLRLGRIEFQARWR